MTKKILRMISLIMCLLFSFNVMALFSNDVGTVKTLLVWEEHAGLLIVHDHMSDPGSCGRVDYYILRKQHPEYHLVFSLLMYAHKENSPVVLFLEGCHEGFNSIKHVTVYK